MESTVGYSGRCRIPCSAGGNAAVGSQVFKRGEPRPVHITSITFKVVGFIIPGSNFDDHSGLGLGTRGTKLLNGVDQRFFGLERPGRGRRAPRPAREHSFNNIITLAAVTSR